MINFCFSRYSATTTCGVLNTASDDWDWDTITTEIDYGDVDVDKKIVATQR